jgi:HSP20 family protein
MDKEGIGESKRELEEKPGENKEGALEEEVMDESAGRSKKQAEKFLNDFTSYIRERQQDFGKTISDYTSLIEKPLADVMETDQEIVIKKDLPGEKKDDIEVNLTENSVEITAKFQEEHSEEEVNYIKKERSYGEARRFLELPAKIEVEKATAKFEDAVLTIKLPKLEKEKFKVDIN